MASVGEEIRYQKWVGWAVFANSSAIIIIDIILGVSVIPNVEHTVQALHIDSYPSVVYLDSLLLFSVLLALAQGFFGLWLQRKFTRIKHGIIPQRLIWSTVLFLIVNFFFLTYSIIEVLPPIPSSIR